MVQRKTVIVALAVFLSAATLGSVRPASSAENARQFLQALSDDAIAILTKESLSAEQREQELGDLFDRGFHLPTVSRFVLGRHWRTASQDQRETYTNRLNC